MNSDSVTTPLPNRLAFFARDIKLSHTIFALPFALLSTFLAAGGMPRLSLLGLILICMVTARTVAMAANRLLDARLDALNPRTAGRAIPAGRLSPGFYLAILIPCVVAFILATGGFWIIAKNPWPFILSIPTLAFINAYPFLKRFTQLCHYYLGAALALAPVGAWIAIKGTIEPPPLWMAAAVLTWTAAFDIIYACQDYQSDLQTRTFSIPARLGIGRALILARLTHVASAVFLVVLGLSSPQLHTLYFIGVAVAVILLLVEHSLVKPTDLSKVNIAFFTLNGIISLLLGTLGILDILL